MTVVYVILSEACEVEESVLFSNRYFDYILIVPHKITCLASQALRMTVVYVILTKRSAWKNLFYFPTDASTVLSMTVAKQTLPFYYTFAFELFPFTFLILTAPPSQSHLTKLLYFEIYLLQVFFLPVLSTSLPLHFPNQSTWLINLQLYS